VWCCIYLYIYLRAGGGGDSYSNCVQKKPYIAAEALWAGRVPRHFSGNVVFFCHPIPPRSPRRRSRICHPLKDAIVPVSGRRPWLSLGPKRASAFPSTASACTDRTGLPLWIETRPGPSERGSYLFLGLRVLRLGPAPSYTEIMWGCAPEERRC
jgi:hypothetical protein